MAKKKAEVKDEAQVGSTATPIEVKELDVSLSVVEWNVVISALRPLEFAETDEILERIAEQSKDTKATGREQLVIKLTNIQVGKILNLIQLLPYNVVARTIFNLFKYIENEPKAEEKVSGNAE